MLKGTTKPFLLHKINYAEQSAKPLTCRLPILFFSGLRRPKLLIKGYKGQQISSKGSRQAG